jgi:hypothetical protein
VSGLLLGIACAHVAQIDQKVDVGDLEIDSIQHLKYLVISVGGDGHAVCVVEAEAPASLMQSCRHSHVRWLLSVAWAEDRDHRDSPFMDALGDPLQWAAAAVRPEVAAIHREDHVLRCRFHEQIGEPERTAVHAQPLVGEDFQQGAEDAAHRLSDVA